MFSMWEQTVRTAANCFLVPNHFSTFRFLGLDIWMSRAKCLKLRFKTPRGPLMVTIRDLTVASIPLGIFTDWLALMVFILRPLFGKGWESTIINTNSNESHRQHNLTQPTNFTHATSGQQQQSHKQVTKISDSRVKKKKNQDSFWSLPINKLDSCKNLPYSH